MFSCFLPCMISQYSEIKMYSSKGAPSGPTSVMTPIFNGHDPKIRSLIGSLVIPSQNYNNQAISTYSMDRTDHPDTFSVVNSIDMCCENNRIKTFEKWPVSFLSAEEVARNGFYYLGHNDVVRCAFCKVEILKWNQGDDPAVEHQRWAPQCPFVRQMTGTKNPGRDECGSRMPVFTPSYMAGPAHPSYSSKTARLRSFQSWPRCMRQKPEDLAEAGLFYTGESDKTICFYCDGGLKDWEEDDVPWEQHARWHEKCAYVQSMKGQEYVQKMVSAACSNTEATEKDIAPVISAAVADASSETVKPLNKSKLCIICYGNERNVCFVPCGHAVACAKCALTVEKCPMCRSTFQSAVRLYFS